MNLNYDHKQIEQKWQKKWGDADIFKSSLKPKNKKYVLDMFPYPSGAGLHVGHPEGYTATDIYCRYLRFSGFDVMHPIGWDAFGLPAENYAIKMGVHPKISTNKNIENFTRQVKSFGFSYDWDREINTSSPEYYKWSQWFFILLYKNGLAYKKKAPVNWCDSCKTVLANEQVVDSKCERCSSDVIKKDLEQWFFKVTSYAEELLSGLDELDWPEALKTMQRNWIGKSSGAIIKFPISNFQFPIEVFTTRPDTLYGATYMVLAPEHKLVNELKDVIENFDEVSLYIERTKKKSELERTELNKNKTGVLLKGVFAINPVNQKEIPIYISDYVLSSYGTGAIMCVPAHDERDFEFANKFNLPIIKVIESDNDEGNEVIESSGVMINSQEFDGMESELAKIEITKKVNGQLTTQYKIRDWLVSRQRYWGAPIPIIYCDVCGTVPVPENDLPVLLPEDINDFRPTGKSPLESSPSFGHVKCPICGADARRECDTMDGFVDNSWYYYRYLDPKNEKEFCSKENIKSYMPIDCYVGGAEHAVGHLIYSRFFTKVLRDNKYIDFGEPFLKLINQGLIMGSDGQKMSKSRGNVVNPDEVINEFGADSFRLYEMFMGPLVDSKPWSTDGIRGQRRFLDKIFQYFENFKYGKDSNDELLSLLHKTIEKVGSDIENFRFNTGISTLMIYFRELSKNQKLSRAYIDPFLIMLSCFAPHISSEIWEKLGNKEFIEKQSWPKYDEKLAKDEKINLPIQVNGKFRDMIEIDTEISEEDLKVLVLSQEKIKKYIDDKEISKFIYVKGRICNIIVR